ncbi:response regulator transcription factor [Longibaculum muris]|uniref:DNA-binding response OmpR family regulator n=1 Tax=Longibaculum muris TaxID=1796628 RepID=A0A4R3YJW7_9FIRM|nr:response regulator transcription factor [Longibaculum muris]KXU42916.1 putative response regulator protein GraR [Candidatus Stoquefichus sp. KLE1796]MBS5371485.1 response regulator transcription factor [Coprobacillus cateniformis]MCR1889140.1 response regulator transcription factor [Longibaculum muris]TCV91678.1 DNA-binding response OmpR family regulator [Longibaculum muris]
MQKIMIVEDDEVISSTLKRHLEKWNFEVYVVEDFEHVMEVFLDYQPTLVLLDISLPFYNGYHWCQEMRKVSEIPIIFISSTNENMNIVMAMNMGADDFINKPFDLNVITAKIQAMIRRTYSFSKQFHILTYKELILNLLEATVSYHDQVIELTKNELKIMQMLFEKAETYVSRDELMIELWQSDQFVDDNTLSVNMNRLRKKLDDFGLDSLIQTKKGIGYKLAYDETASLL